MVCEGSGDTVIVNGGIRYASPTFSIRSGRGNDISAAIRASSGEPGMATTGRKSAQDSRRGSARTRTAPAAAGGGGRSHGSRATAASADRVRRDGFAAAKFPAMSSSDMSFGRFGKLSLGIIGCAVFACSTAAPRPRAVAKEVSGGPAHAVEVAQGLWSCERGYVLHERQCLPEDLVPSGPRVEMYSPDDLEAPPPAPSRDRRLTAMPGFDWKESDYPPRPVVSYRYSPDGPGASTVIGDPTSYELPEKKTAYEAARHLGLGINQVAAAFPDLDFLKPPFGNVLDFPTWWILPEADHEGIVINIPEMRLYYYPAAQPGTVITYPVGLGDDGWQTPIARFRIIEKNVDPTWLIPESIRAEHIRERGDPRTMIPGGAADNPLGHYRLRLSLPLYGIHGTNVPWGIGMEVTHGCVRLYPEDIQQLFSIVPIGTPGQFVYQPVKVGTRGGEIYIEVHPDVYETRFEYLPEALRLLGAHGWKDRVDWPLLEAALGEKRGEPTRISSPTAPALRSASR
jgi:L,D-transpeptidase ErfK/SrfK